MYRATGCRDGGNGRLNLSARIATAYRTTNLWSLNDDICIKRSGAIKLRHLEKNIDFRDLRFNAGKLPPQRLGFAI